MDVRVQALFQKFLNLNKSPQYLEDPNKARCTVCHYINTTGPPIFEKARELRLDIARQVKREFDEIIKPGICRPPSGSQWSSSLVTIQKDQKKKFRISGDYKSFKL